MPVARNQQGQRSKNTNAASPKKHRWYKGVLVIVAGLALISVVLFYIIGGSMAGDKTSMERYLRDKYGQEFKVTDLKDRAVAIGDPGQRVGIGHPVNDSSLTFEVGKSRKTTDVYFDDYGGAVWEREERPRVAAFLQTLYGASMASDFELRTHIATPATPDPIRGKVPSISEAIKQYKNNFFYSLGLTSTVDALNDSNRNDIRTKFTKLAEYIKDKGAGLSYLTLKINVTSENAGYLCSLQKEQFNDVDTVLNSCLDKPTRKGLYK